MQAEQPSAKNSGKLSILDMRGRRVEIEVSSILSGNQQLLAALEISISAKMAVLDAPRLISLKLGKLVSAEEAYFEHANLLLQWRDLYSFQVPAGKALYQTLEVAKNDVNPSFVFLPLLAHRKLPKPIRSGLALDFVLMAIAKAVFVTPKNLGDCLKRAHVGVSAALIDQHLQLQHNQRLTLYLKASLPEIKEALTMFAIQNNLPLPRLRDHAVDYANRSWFLWQFFTKLDEYTEDDPWHLVSLTRKALKVDQDRREFPEDIL